MNIGNETMAERIQLKHPQGKKAVTMDTGKYNLLKPAILRYLRAEGGSTFGAVTKAIAKEFKTKGQKFDGSLNWHLEWVKLDLEARKLIRRVPKTSPQEYVIVR
jgi:hypothetical protein